MLLSLKGYLRSRASALALSRNISRAVRSVTSRTFQSRAILPRAGGLLQATRLVASTRRTYGVSKCHCTCGRLMKSVRAGFPAACKQSAQASGSKFQCRHHMMMSKLSREGGHNMARQATSLTSSAAKTRELVGVPGLSPMSSDRLSAKNPNQQRTRPGWAPHSEHSVCSKPSAAQV